MADFDHSDLFRSWCARSAHYGVTHTEVADAARAFVQREIVPHVSAWEKAGAVPREVNRAAGEAGLLGLGFPEQYGGISEGIDQFHHIAVGNEFARCGAGGVQASLFIHAVGLWPILRVGSEALKERVAAAVLRGEKLISLAVTEPSGGSDVANLRTSARGRGDHYVVNGSKLYITSGMRSDYFTVAVRTGGAGPKGVSLLLIERGMKGFTQTPLEKMGWDCSDTAALYFDDVEVPLANLIGAEGAAFPAMMANFNGERIGIAANACAYAWLCIEDAIAWARERETFGQRLIERQVIRHKIAEMFRQVIAAQTWVDACAAAANALRPVSPAELALLKIQATRALEYCAREAVQILGAAGCVKPSRVERIYREVRLNAIGGGSEEVMFDLAARQLGL
jgi:acyl-CoA dehydrogenase